MADWAVLVESGRGIMAAPRLGRADQAVRGPEDHKFSLGDLVADQDVDDSDLDRLAKEIGHNLTGANLKSYREVARAWPPARRVAASWTVHRTLKNVDNRYGLIQPGMTLRGAQLAAGKTPADTEHPSRWDVERRVEFLVTQLQDGTTARAVREKVEGRKHARNVKATTKAVQEERSAEYREALKELREARDAKHPERAVYDAIFKIRDAREYLRAVGKESTGEESFIPDHRRPDVAAAVRDLALGAIEALVALGLTDPSVSSGALAELTELLQRFDRTRITSGFSGIIIDADGEVIVGD